MIKHKPTKNPPRSGIAVAAQHRRAGRMDHRTAPRGNKRQAARLDVRREMRHSND